MEKKYNRFQKSKIKIIQKRKEDKKEKKWKLHSFGQKPNVEEDVDDIKKCG